MESTMTTIQELKDLLSDAVWDALGEGVELSITTAEGPKTIVLRAEPAEGDDVDPPVTVTAELDAIKLRDLAALTQLAGGVIPDVIPPEIPVADLIEFRGVKIVIAQSPAPRHITAVTLDVQSAKPWALVEGQFVLEKLLFSISVKSPLDAATRAVSCKAKSTLTLGDGLTLDTSMALPSLDVTLALAEDEPAPLKPLLDRIVPGAGLPELTLTRLDAQVKPREQSYAFGASIEGEWEVLPGMITLSELGMDLSSTGGGQPAVKIEGAFSMAGVELNASAERARTPAPVTPPAPGSPVTPAVWEFVGETKEDQEIAVGALVADLTDKIGLPVPGFLEDLTLTSLSAEFNTKTTNLSVRSHWKSTGCVAFDSYPSQPAPLGKTLIASFTNPDGEEVSIKEMVAGVSADLAAIVPAGLRVSLNSALFASWQLPPAIKSKMLFGVDVGGGIDLSELPLVGQNFTPEDGLKLTYTVLIPSDVITEAEIKALVPLFSEQGAKLAPIAFPTKALSLRGELKIGDFSLPLNVPVQVNKDTGEIGTPPGIRSDDMEPQWFSIQKALGPVNLERVGVKFAEEKLWVLLDASLSLGALSVGLSGLSVSSDIWPLSPEFHLDGLALDYRSGALEIGGTFLRRTVTLDGDEVETYDGLAVLKAKLGGKALSLSAIGGYAQVQGQPSLFLYAVLGMPIGGPPFFFVEGLAAGFGVNRALTVPTVDKINKFPLVSEAMSGHHSIGDAESRAGLLQEKLAALGTYIKPQIGAGFLAVGVKFSSFKVVNGFALLTMSLGERFELHVLGLAQLTVPFAAAEMGVDPIAKMEIALKASFIPEEGFLGVIAQLTPESFILSRDCKLTGGFAFYTWLAGKHAGDFVITMGGYHPRFKVPDHYPRVPRLGFNWRIGDTVIIKGEQYFALCAHAVMAGGSLEVSFEAGSAHASFRASADFLIGWKPYHYDIELRVGISAGFGFLGDIDISAGLHIWGPEFGGYAEIDVTLFSFTIEFGDQGSRYPKAIPWSEFRDGFLPPGEEICSVAVTNGLLRQLTWKGEELWVVNPKEFSLATDAFVPTKTAWKGESRTPLEVGTAKENFGVRPMGKKPDEVGAEHWIRITKDTDDGAIPAEDMFAFVPVTKLVPSAVWGTARTVEGDRVLPPHADDPRFVGDGVVTGYQITTARLPKPSDTDDILTEVLRYDTTQSPEGFGWAPIAPFASSGSDEERRERLRATVGTNATRDKLLGALGFDPARDVLIRAEALAQTFVVAPEVQ